MALRRTDALGECLLLFENTHRVVRVAAIGFFVVDIGYFGFSQSLYVHICNREEITMRSRLVLVGVFLLMAVRPAAATGPPQASSPSRFFRLQYHKPDLSFCNSTVCVDFDGDGKRELLFASRKTKELQMLNAAEGTVVWRKKLAGDQQSISAYDLDRDGDFEILYTVSGPGRLYVLDHSAKVLRQWDSGDWKLGNSAACSRMTPGPVRPSWRGF